MFNPKMLEQDSSLSPAMYLNWVNIYVMVFNNAHRIRLIRDVTGVLYRFEREQKSRIHLLSAGLNNVLCFMLMIVLYDLVIAF